MGLELEFREGETPLSEEDKNGLLIKTISNRSELDLFEQQNIERALIWLQSSELNIEQILDESFIRQLHIKMFDQTWRWAGKYRTVNTNIGVEFFHIPNQLRSLIEDAQLWFREDLFTPDELAIRIKHRIVSIHCFPNGNGRHSRILADTIVSKVYGSEVFSWGGGQLTNATDLRIRYITALRQADQDNFEDLIEFARS